VLYESVIASTEWRELNVQPVLTIDAAVPLTMSYLAD
jgi:hypothetical protein